jgi:hypothetical protein
MTETGKGKSETSKETRPDKDTDTIHNGHGIKEDNNTHTESK